MHRRAAVQGGNEMDVTVLIPAYQPAGELVALVKALKQENFRIVVVDDGSGPDYVPIFSQVSAFAQVLSYPRNGGKGFALKYGMRYLAEEKERCGAFITADADGQHSVRDICRVREELEKGHPFVLTTRALKGKDVPFRSRLGNTMSRFICALSGGYYLSDNQSGLRGFTAEYLSWLCKISGNKYDYEMNVLLYAERQELPIRCLPIEVIYLNNNQSSHFDPVRDTLRIYLRVLCTARVSIFMAVLHGVLIGAVSLLLGWDYSALTIPLCALLIAALGYLCNRFLVFRGLRYGCGPRTFIITAIRTSMRFTFCSLLNMIPGMPLLPAWLISCVLTVPVEYAFLRLLALWYEYRASRHS